MSPRKILVAMSGGVDSSVAAALLKDQGYEVGGATIRVWISSRCGLKDTNQCCGVSGILDARKVAEALGIPHHIFHMEDAFKHRVVDLFAQEYQKGRTPNPCISCNEHIKFRLFLERARELGYDAMATGHYAQVHHDGPAGASYLSEGKDPAKDQSYVLFPLGQDLLKSLLLPLGSLTKKEVREKARTLGLSVMNKPESQEICFVPNDEYGKFLDLEYGTQGTPGEIRHKDGRLMGRHPGYHYFTKGQRRGLGVAFTERLYVIETRPETNEVIVGSKSDILSRHCRIAPVHWFWRPAGGVFRAQVKIRSQHRKAWAEVRDLGSGAEIFFEEPQEAVTPGQAAVFYDGPKVIGGGWIETAGET